MKVTLNTNLFPIISVGMYNSNISPDEIFDDYTINDDKENGYIHFDSEYYWDNFQNDKYKKRIAELAGEYLNGKIVSLNGTEITIKCRHIFSPSYYNFSTDEIVIDVTYNKRKLLQVAKDERDQFEAFLKAKYTSYDGFASFTSNNYDDWLIGFKDNDSRDVGAILSYIYFMWQNEDHGTFDEYVRNELSYGYSEFIDSEDYEAEVVILETYVKENYKDLTIDSIDFDSFEFEILDNDSCKKIVVGIFNSIENNTLSMF